MNLIPKLVQHEAIKMFSLSLRILSIWSLDKLLKKRIFWFYLCVLPQKSDFVKIKKGSQFGLTYLDVIKNVTWKASSQLSLFCKYILGKKGRRKSVPKFFLGKREGSFRWSLSDEVWTATRKDSYHYRVGPINNINETPSNTPISMWDSLEVSRQLFLHHFCCQEML